MKALTGFEYYCWLLKFTIIVNGDNLSQFSTNVFHEKETYILHIVVNNSTYRENLPGFNYKLPVRGGKACVLYMYTTCCQYIEQERKPPNIRH